MELIEILEKKFKEERKKFDAYDRDILLVRQLLVEKMEEYDEWKEQRNEESNGYYEYEIIIKKQQIKGMKKLKEEQRIILLFLEEWQKKGV